MPTTHDAHRLMAEAAKPGVSLAESTRLVNEAQAILAAHRRTAALDREVDLANTAVTDHLVPVRVHEHHTASTDWLGQIDTGQDLRSAEHDILAQATLWYGKTASLVKENPGEFTEQARGVARKMAGAFGERADAAEDLFLSHVTAMHDREVKAGTITVEADASVTMPEAGGGQFQVFPTGNYEQALPGEATTSERAPAIQELGGAPSSGATDVTAENDPGLGVTNSTADADNGDANTRRSASRKEATPMQHAQCPTCGGHGRVAVRLVPKEAASTLDQIQEIADPQDNPKQTPLPAEVAFPWVMNPALIGQAIQQTEQQVAERNAKSPLISGTASRAEAAQKAAEATYRRVLAGGYDDSGWAGDMGAQGWQPGQQDGGNPPSSNLGEPDPVYGYGGDQPDRPVKPYGASEAADYTNNPGQNWQPGQPTQMDMGGRQMSTDAPNTYQVGPNAGQKAASADPEIAKAQAFINQRRAWLQGQGH